jgi:hypothetical protein
VLPWWERFPGRLEAEMQALQDVGADPHLDQTAFAQGLVRVAACWRVDSEAIPLVIEYPDSFPYFRPEVLAPSLDFGRHQNPVAKNLCLVNRDTRNWLVKDTAAKFIAERLPLLFKAVASNDLAEVANLEEHQGEPFSDYLPYQISEAMVLVDGDWSVPSDLSRGTLAVGVSPLGLRKNGLRGAVLEVRRADGLKLVAADVAITRLYSITVDGVWVRLKTAPVAEDAPTFAALLKAVLPPGYSPMFTRVGDVSLGVIGVLFPEEVSWRKSSDSWAFLAIQRQGA